MAMNELDRRLFEIVKSSMFEEIDLHELNEILSKGGNVDAKNENGDPLLFVAIEYASVSTLRFLLNSGANPNCFNEREASLLSVAAEFDRNFGSDYNLLRLLLKSNTNINLINSKGHNILWDAIATAEEALVTFLLREGADAKALDGKGHSILHHLANLDLTEIRLQPLQYRKFFPRCTQMLRFYGAALSQADLGEEFCTTLEKYIEFGNREEAEFFKIYWKSGIRSVRNPLIAAASNPLTDVLRVLLDCKLFNVNDTNECGMTPLHVATRCKNIENIKLLLKHGADANIRTKWNGETPYLIAYEAKSKQCKKLLSKCGARPTERESEIYKFNDGASEWLNL